MMKDLKEYIIPVKGLGSGVHQYSFKLNEAFFSHFEGSPITNSDIEVQLDLDKRLDMLALDFDISGWYESTCNRCLKTIEVPLDREFQLLVKYSEQNQEEEAEVFYISTLESHLSVAQFVYEYACLSIPVIKNCEDDHRGNQNCSPEIFKYLNGDNEPESKDEEIPIWDALKSMKFDKKDK